MRHIHIYFKKDFDINDLPKYGFIKSKWGGYYELWIGDKRAIVVPMKRRVRGGPHLSLESCVAKTTIEMLSVVVKMAQDGILEVYDEDTIDIKKRQLEKLQNEIKYLEEE